MKKMKLIYKQCGEWDYLRDTDWGGQLWGCSYTLDRESMMRANDVDVLLDYINDCITIYTDDITDEELDTLRESGYDRLSWNDYDYYCCADELEDWARHREIPCIMDSNNAIIDVTVDDCGHIVEEAQK